MTRITITDEERKLNNLIYVKTSVGETLTRAGASAHIDTADGRAIFTVEFSDEYADVLRTELADKLGEVIAINYKYDFFKEAVGVSGLNAVESEIMLASLIAADLPDDKKYAARAFLSGDGLSVDGVYNFRLRPLKNKWRDVASYMPDVFVGSQLREFITYLLENKKKRVYIDHGKVYDSHYRRLKRCELLGGGDAVITREVLLSNCGEVELLGALGETDEKYLRQYYGDKIFFSSGYST